MAALLGSELGRYLRPRSDGAMVFAAVLGTEGSTLWRPGSAGAFRAGSWASACCRGCFAFVFRSGAQNKEGEMDGAECDVQQDVLSNQFQINKKVTAHCQVPGLKQSAKVSVATCSAVCPAASCALGSAPDLNNSMTTYRLRSVGEC